MAKVALLYNGTTGEVIGHLFCSDDDDLVRQVMPEGRNWALLEVAADHPAITDHKGWKIVTDRGKKSPLMRGA